MYCAKCWSDKVAEASMEASGPFFMIPSYDWSWLHPVGEHAAVSDAAGAGAPPALTVSQPADSTSGYAEVAVVSSTALPVVSYTATVEPAAAASAYASPSEATITFSPSAAAYVTVSPQAGAPPPHRGWL